MEIREASIHGFQSRLWALNATAYHDSEHFPNGTVKSMSNQTRDAMYASLYGVHEDMTGKIKLFTTGRAINTTAGAYLSQFASLHVSVMTNLLAPVTYRTEGGKGSAKSSRILVTPHCLNIYIYTFFDVSILCLIHYIIKFAYTCTAIKPCSGYIYISGWHLFKDGTKSVHSLVTDRRLPLCFPDLLGMLREEDLRASH